jgi:hyperosmotically inducible periplasmic protein
MKPLFAVIFAAGLLAPPAMAQGTSPSPPADTKPDNTRVNKADRRDTSNTAQSQSQAKPDRELAAAVRKAIVNDKSLSTYAHNVKVITRDGSVTLRGPVRNIEEKAKVADLAKQVPNVTTIDNQLTVKSSKASQRKE